jgi:prepilin-type processing-associated H-X9-DG protein
MAGEKYLHPNFYTNQTESTATGGSAASDNPGDNASMYLGYDQDTVRWPNGSVDNSNQPQGNLPTRDTELTPQQYQTTGVHRMGSPHTGGVNLVYADGSVRAIGFDVDPLVWQGYAHRDDGG